MLSVEERDDDFKSVEEWLDEIDYSPDENYSPSEFALAFVNFIKLVEDGNPENKTPVVHYKMIDNFISTEDDRDVANMCHRGIAKTTLKEYLILYIAVFGVLPGLGKVPYALYVSDSIENGVKKMRKSLEYKCHNSQFLQEYLTDTKFTDVRWEFINRDGSSLVVSGHGAQTGVRGTRENNSRPVLALLDDLVSDEDARSPTCIAAIEDTVYKAVDYALHPTYRKIIWSGTPFNSKDPLYKAVESGAWKVNVYPVCEKFPCTEEEFKGSWPDRFDYAYVRKQYDKAKAAGMLDTFNQELMLRILSEEDRLIQKNDIQWYVRRDILNNKGLFNFYITTDFTTSESEKADYCGVSVWAINSLGNWYWVDGILEKQGMTETIDDLFRFAQQYRPQLVGIEASGQQAGFIDWIKAEMLRRNIWFNIAKQKNSNQLGIRPVVNKFKRFSQVVPWFNMGLMHFPQELRESRIMIEAMMQLELVSRGGFKSKHDDFLDTVSMLLYLDVWKPSDTASLIKAPQSGVWALDEEDDIDSALDSYLV